MAIDKNIARIFRAHNIVEYKSPRDSFSTDDLFKTFAYVFLYAVVEGVDSRNCTLTLAGARKPAKLMEYLRTMPWYRVEKTAEGVYYVHGKDFPIQIVETKRRKNDLRVIFASLVFLTKN
ncbi:MAG: hypothetical protein Pg6C_10820 [Treponemataceae bacterium]|nr:MAG: hypothetical protein Pg6C_10820 [Treponemataceae bacterium]